MIKIIKRGTRKQATCEKCGCIFSYEEEDVKHLERRDCNYTFGDTRPAYKTYVICPQCNTDFVINQTRDFSTESEGENQ